MIAAATNFTWEQLRAEIESLLTDPLGCVVVQTWPTRLGEVRWDSGYIQTRRVGSEFFSLPIVAHEFLERAERK